MERRRRSGQGCAWAALAAAFLTLFAPPIVGAGEAQNVRLVHNSERFAVARALAGAAKRLERPDCQALLDEFSDTTGRPLRAGAEELGVTAPQILGRVLFYDAPPRWCGRTSALAVTTPGSRAVVVCGSRFVREMAGNPRHAEAIVIHEALHSLGLGENPPTSEHITQRVLARCGGREGETVAAARTP